MKDLKSLKSLPRVELTPNAAKRFEGEEREGRQKKRDRQIEREGKMR